MIGRALNSNNDLVLVAGQIATVEQMAETAQHCRTRLLFYTGEWFLDTDAGTPWFQEIFVKPTNLANVESIIKSRILNTPGVLSLTDFAMDYQGGRARQLKVDFSANTIYATEPLELTFVLNQSGTAYNA
jgi:hypothetical protein